MNLASDETDIGVDNSADGSVDEGGRQFWLPHDATCRISAGLWVAPSGELRRVLGRIFIPEPSAFSCIIS